MQKSVALTTLQEALDDDVATVWSTDELNFILDAALAQVNQVRPRSVRDDIDLTDDVDLYSLENVYTVTRIDWLDSTGRMVATIPPQAWEVWGINDVDEFEFDGTTQQIFLNRRWARTGYAMRVHGYAPWVWDAEEGG